MKKTFIFSNNQLEYTLKLRKRRPWWLLLLLLLPLLLLIRFDKIITVQTLDAIAKTPVSGAEVHFNYTKSFAYEKGHFFTTNHEKLTGQSDASGKATFKVQCSIYSWLFKHNETALVWAVNNCYNSDSLRPVFHRLDNNEQLTLQMQPATIEFDFKAIDKNDMADLPDSKITIIAEFSGIRYSYTDTCDAAGRVLFSKLPLCGRILSVRAEHEGYYPDSIVNRSLPDISGPLERIRTLQLRPIRKPIEFFVENCTTVPHQPIPNATVEIEFDFNGKKSKTSIHTNTDGKGKGTYDEAYIIALIRLKASADYYKNGELLGQHLVSDFIDSIKYPRSKRTICLEPEPNPLTFTNVDERTGKPLKGVKNTISIADGNGKIHTVIKESNNIGNFSVSINPGEKISIVSQLQPDYEDNNTKVQNEDCIQLMTGPAEKRVIRLKPKIVDLVFRTVDAEHLNKLIPGADLLITVDGLIQPMPKNSDSGQFKVSVTFNSTISIAVSKAGFGENHTKILGSSVQLLFKSPQEARDIPLKGIKYFIIIENDNDQPDESFEVFLNEKKLGIINHKVSREQTKFGIEIEENQDNEILLKYTGDGGSKDTGEKLTIEPMGIFLRFNGDNKSYKFRFNAANRTIEEIK